MGPKEKGCRRLLEGTLKKRSVVQQICEGLVRGQGWRSDGSAYLKSNALRRGCKDKSSELEDIEVEITDRGEAEELSAKCV